MAATTRAKKKQPEDSQKSHKVDKKVKPKQRKKNTQELESTSKTPSEPVTTSGKRGRAQSATDPSSKPKRIKGLAEDKVEQPKKGKPATRSYAAPPIIDSDEDAEPSPKTHKKAKRGKDMVISDEDESESATDDDDDSHSEKSEAKSKSDGSDSSELDSDGELPSDGDVEVEKTSTRLQERLLLEKPTVRGIDTDRSIKDKGKQSTHRSRTDKKPSRGVSSGSSHTVTDGIKESYQPSQVNGQTMVKSEDGVDVSPHLGAKFVTNGEAPKSPLELVPPNIPGGKLALGKQHHRLVHCITLAIDHTYLSLFCENAFPLLPEKRRQYRRALSTAAAETDSSDIAMELGSNADYAQWLASVPDARANNIKNNCKKAAEVCVVDLYRLDLRDPEACKARVAQLKQRLPDYMFIFPEDLKTGKADMGKPFLHPIIIRVLSNAAGVTEAIQRLLPKFSPDPVEEPKVPHHLLALACAAIYHALDEYSTGVRVRRNFTADGAKPIYKDHLESLENLANNPENAETYHILLRKIFRLAFPSIVNMSKHDANSGERTNKPQQASHITINLD